MEVATIEYQDIFTTFAETEYGQRLQDSVRWKKYNLGELSNGDWCDLLGQDANNLHHMQVTYELAQEFIDRQNSSDKAPIDAAASTLLLLSAIIHDQAEAITDDVSYGDKTQADELSEVTAFEAHLDAMNPGMDAVTKTMARSAIRGVIFDPSTPEGAVFNAIEKTGYLVTALHAAKNRPSIHDREVAKGLDWLVADVLLHQIPALTDYSTIYSMPHEVLRQNAKLIDQLFAGIPSEVFEQYGDMQAQRRNAFENAHQIWLTFAQDSL